MAVTQITVSRIPGDCKFRFSIVKPAHRVLLPEGRQHEPVRGGGRCRVDLERLRQGLNRGGGGDGRLRGSGLIHLHHCLA